MHYQRKPYLLPGKFNCKKLLCYNTCEPIQVLSKQDKHKIWFTGFPPTGKSGKTWQNKVVRECFCFSKKSELFLNADYHEIKTCHDIHQKNIVIIISFYEIKFCTKCWKWSGQFVSRSGKKSGTFFPWFLVGTLCVIRDVN